MTQVICPVCGAPTWLQMSDGFQTIFCYSASCNWKQQIRPGLTTQELLDELKGREGVYIADNDSMFVAYPSTILVVRKQP